MLVRVGKVLNRSVTGIRLTALFLSKFISLSLILDCLCVYLLFLLFSKAFSPVPTSNPGRYTFIKS